MDIRRKIMELAKEYGIKGTGNIEDHKNDIVILIKHLPFFYDHTDPNFKSLASRDHAWSALADVFKTSKDDVKFKWKSLRECYRRQQLRQEANRKNRKRSAEPDHPLLTEMAYLDEATKKKSKLCDTGASSTDHEYYIMEDVASIEGETGNGAIETVDQDKEEEEEESFTLSDSDLEYEENATEDSSEEQTDPKTAKNSSESNDLIMVEDLEDKYNLFADVKDVEDFLFAKLIAYELRKITCPIKRLRVKAEILRIIASYAEKE